MSEPDVAVQDGHHAMTYRELAEAAAIERDRVPHGDPTVVRSSRAVDVAVALRAYEGWASDVHLAGPLDIADPLPRAVSADSATRWHLYTSGTTGAPKAVAHTFASLARTVRPAPPSAEPRSWGLLYTPTRMAGIQVIVHSLAGGGRLLDATHLPRIIDRVRWLADNGVTALSATPTTWRQILQCPDSTRLRLDQITLGGEIADQPLLNALVRAHPQARITHVFASTESGVAFSVHDGLAGFPRLFLTDPPRGIRLEIRNDALFVHAPDSSVAGGDGFVPTGDAVTVTADRVFFHGRTSGMANVGGVKVWPEQVEAVLRRHELVRDTVVTTRSNPFSGSVLTAEVVAVAGSDTQALPAQLRSYCAAHLERAAVPAIVKVVPELRTNLTGKATRG
jgi:acyl-CoA synthetase (AMP-forming)/AMP-acid ligase II